MKAVLFALSLSLRIIGVHGDLIGRAQSIAVTGILICDEEPARNVKVKLYDDDAGLDLDDFMAEVRTDEEGRFAITGTSSEIMAIDPKLNIYHDCNDDWIPCQRKLSVLVPKEYITGGTKARQSYDIGTIQLSGSNPGEERDCFNR
ncbi:hypothetical protein AB6A40_003194 [Gnathostoma spinigerum]|uniref:Transthyretin-like protein 5 n=1 Tax=Gnathostoma spinigerum TaxID=75299 RepID=A0ABD6EJN4_9BILA